MSPVLALFRFYVRGGVRLAWRAAIPIVAAPTVAVAMSPDPSGTLQDLTRGAVAPDGGYGMTLAVAMAAFAVAAWATPRLIYGVSAWLRHLPADEASHRRAILFALTATQLPVVFLWIAFGCIAVVTQIPLDSARLLGILFLVLGTSHLALPCRHRGVLSISGAAGILAALTADGALMGLGVAAFVGADRWAGPLVGSGFRPPTPGRLALRAGPLPIRLTWRAIRRRWYAVYVLPAILLGINALFVRNNELSSELIGMATRFGAGLAVLAGVTHLGKLIGTTRPPWPWARSLPWSSFRRVAEDAAVLSLLALPLVAVTALIHPGAAMAISATLPYLSTRTTAAVRHPVTDMTLGELFLVTGSVALLPWTALVWLFSTPFALWHARRKERRARSTHWDDMRALGGGDTQSWSGG